MYAIIDICCDCYTRSNAVTVIHACIVISAVIVMYVGLQSATDYLLDQKDVHLLHLTIFLQQGGSCDAACAQS